MCGPRKPVPRAGLWPAGRMLHASALEKADPEMFSFWVNDIFAEKQVLFDICGLMQSRQSSYQTD